MLDPDCANRINTVFSYGLISKIFDNTVHEFMCLLD